MFNDRKATILLIDDDYDQLFVFASYLACASFGSYNVEVASSAEEGLAKAHCHRIDCVVCDVMMPQLNGREFVEKLRESQHTQDIPVILFSAASDMLEVEVQRYGADMFCAKQDAKEKLLAQVNHLVS